jgi:FMN reductase [NAD(P)H]
MSHPNETMRLLCERASLRNFSDRPVPDAVLDPLLDAGRRGATGGNLQPYSIIKIRSQETKDELAALCHQKFIAKAPVNLVFCIDWRRLERWAGLEAAPFTACRAFRHFWISMQDTVIAAQQVCTAADAMGLGSVYIGTVVTSPEAFTACRGLLGLPRGVLPVVLLCLGYPKTRPEPAKKLPLSVLVHEETYRDPEDDELAEVFGEKYEGGGLKVVEKDKRVEHVLSTCREVGGEDLVDRARKRMEETGSISRAQYIFGLHYDAAKVPAGNGALLAEVEEYGFGWFSAGKE